MLTPIYPDYARACDEADDAATALVTALEKALTLYPAKLGEGERAAIHTALRAARTAAFVCLINVDWGGEWPEVLSDEQVAAEARQWAEDRIDEHSHIHRPSNHP